MENNPAQNQPSSTPDVESQNLNAAPPPASNEVVKKTSKFSIKAIIGTIIFLLLAGGAAASFTVFKPQILSLISKSTPTPSPITTTSPTPTPDPTADWKTYTNTKYGYSLKYPQSDFVQLHCPDDESDNFYLTKRTPDEKRETIETETCARDRSFDLEIVMLSKPYPLELQSDLVDIKQSDITLAGVSAKKYIRTIKPDADCPCWDSTNIYLDHNGKRYFITFSTPEKYDTFDQILSTLKFTDSQTTDTSNWKTYRSEGFEFKHRKEIIPSKEQSGNVHLHFREPLLTGAPDGYELSPGFIMDFKLTSMGTDSLKSIVDEKIEELKGIQADITTPSTPTTIGDYSGYRFSGVTQIGFEKIFLASKSKSYIEINYSINDQNNKDYQNEINQILSTFKFTN